MKEVDSEQSLNATLKEAEFCVALFSASWCQPCQKLKKQISENDLAGKFPKIEFVVIDCDEQDDDLDEKFDVEAMPTMIFFAKDAAQSDLTIQGAKYDELVENCGKLCKEVSSNDS